MLSGLCAQPGLLTTHSKGSAKQFRTGRDNA
jgi:hypothetical protein